MAWNTDLEGPGLQFAGSQASRLRALAGPGTGKTHSLIRRIARLLEAGSRGEELLIVSFTRTAASDLEFKIRRMEDERFQSVRAQTLHSYCFRVLATERFFRANDRVPRIALEFERDFILLDLVGGFGHTLTARRKLANDFAAAWARAQTDRPGQPVDGLDQSFQDALLEALRWHKGMLIGEVVPHTLAYLRQNPDGEERRGYSHVLVDEYQDLNRAEQVLIDLLSDETDLAVIGDDDQSIYRFKNANPEGIREFRDTHEGTEDVPFTECRRCAVRIVALAQAVIERNPDRLRGPLVAKPGNPDGEIHNVQWTSIEDEANAIARFIEHKVQRGIDPGMCLVLAGNRTIGNGIKHAVQGRGIEIRSFFREEAVKTETAQEKLTLLTLFAKPDDRIALRSWIGLQSPSGLVASYRALLAVAQARGTDVKTVLELVAAKELRVPHSKLAFNRWLVLQQQLEPLERFRDDVHSLVNAVLPETGQDEAEDELALLRRLALSAADEAESVEELPDIIRHRIGQPEVPLETPYARVMSFHKSKGLTADLVILAGLVNGIMPIIKDDAPLDEQRATREEQRRLFFVGITRASKILVFSSYSQLHEDTVFKVRAKRGRYSFREKVYTTFASDFLEETGPSLPPAVRGEGWIRAYQ